MVLEELIERKDLLAYCSFRIRELSANRYLQVKEIPPKKREMFNQRQVGAMRELRIISSLAKNHQIKSASIKASLQVYPMEKKVKEQKSLKEGEKR
jgi:predicted lysophospholipase L1 biosynthesis ABC-type transport system permease subunit